MTKIRITMYKDSGKYYTDEVVTSEKNMFEWSDEFKRFVVDNLPATLSEGYIVVEDMPDGHGFHNVLYKTSELLLYVFNQGI